VAAMIRSTEEKTMKKATTITCMFLDIENTPMFVQIAEGLGIRSILHADYRSTRAKLASFELQN
jgi:putative hydrolase of the HAD superfamily